MNWDEFSSALNKLYGKIDETPDIVVAIARGGLIPGVFLARHFDVKDLYALTVKKREGKRQVLNKIIDDLSGKKVLLVEDIVDSGKSMSAAKKYLESRNAKVMTAAVYMKPSAVFRPDYVAGTDENVQFPWEV